MFAIPNPYPGLLVAFEGIDGCGKSSQLALAELFLDQKVKPKINGCRIVRAKEPNRDTPAGERIYQELARSDGLHKLNPYLFQTWYAIDSKGNMANLVIPHLQQGNIVLTDRCRASMVYGMTQAGNATQWARLLEMHWAIMGEHFIWPDAVLIFDLPVATAIERLTKQGKSLDAHERAAVLEMVRANYISCWRGTSCCHVIEAEAALETVFQRCLPILNEAVFQKFQFYPN